MGWWNEIATGDKLVLGDEPIDLLSEAIAAFSRSYLEDVGRKPTLEEFRRTLLLPLGTDPGRYFADMEAAVVGEVAFRLKKVPQRQTVAVGDYFAVPLDGRFWYGRLIHDSSRHLVAIYDVQTERLLTLPQLLARKRKVVLNKHVFSIPVFTRGRWKIIGHQDMPEVYPYPAYFGGMVAHGNYIIWRGPVETREPKRVAMMLEPASIFPPERIEQALRKKEFGEWPEITASKKETFDSHDERLKFMHAYFKIPMKKKRK
jgi:hypothetical protein